VGEQPGDVEDRAGRPFVGPAGRLLRELLEEAGIAEDSVYLTNITLTQFHRGGERALSVSARGLSREERALLSLLRSWRIRQARAA
jgi:DNA polymerase